MGHYLKTINEDAADQIDNPSAPPDVGTIVVYIPRQGHVRGHRSEFPGLVLGHTPDGDLQLLLMLEADDQIMEDRVPFQSHNQPQHCWRYVNDVRLDAIKSAVDDLATGLAELTTQIHGDFEPSGISVVDHLANFAKRLDKVEAALSGKGKKGA